MQYRPFGNLGFDVSALGLGCMRLPRKENPVEGEPVVDREKSIALIRHAVDKGITYIDTALSYHKGFSEIIVGEALDGGSREKVKIATKVLLPAIPTNDDIRRRLETTLKNLRTDYLDCYLIHNIHQEWWDEIKRRNIMEEYEKLRQEGLIRHIGFSFHGNYELFREVYEYYPWDMCQMQQNILDVDREATEDGIFLTQKRKTALVIMEPLRGGNLINPPPAVQKVYDEYPGNRKPVEWAFRHLLNYPEVSCILSGMSSIEQIDENIEIFSKPDALSNCLSEKEKKLLREAKSIYDSIPGAIPCTGCEYCLPCPQGVAIPSIFKRYNESVMFHVREPSQRWYMLLKRDECDAGKCVACGACEKLCPQNISIIEKLQAAKADLEGWVE